MADRRRTHRRRRVSDPIGVIADLVAAGRAGPGSRRGRVGGRQASPAAGPNAAASPRPWPAGPRCSTDGRSPAPRAVGDLLIALRQAGAATVSPPFCAECGKPLRTLQRRGEDWYCGVCGPVRQPCAGCGDIGRVHSRDRDGQPRCTRCPPGDGRDPVEIVVEVVTAIDPALPAEVDRRGGERGSRPGRAAPPAGLDAAGPARPAHRGGRRGAGPVGAAADRQALRRGRRQASSARPARTAAG